MADVLSTDVSETVTTPEKKVADSPVKEKKVPDSPAKKIESPLKAENGSSKVEEDDDDVKENGASEEEEDAEKEQNGDTNEEEETESCQKGCKRKSGALEAVEAEVNSDKKAKLEEAEEDPATAEPETVEA